MLSKNYLFVPHFTALTYTGQARLDALQEVCEYLTASANELRDSGFKKITLEMIIRRTQEHRPGLAVDESLLSYTGKRVTINEKAFAAWYATTDEGRQVLKDNERVAPGIGLRFASILRKH